MYDSPELPNKTYCAAPLVLITNFKTFIYIYLTVGYAEKNNTNIQVPSTSFVHLMCISHNNYHNNLDG